MTRQRIGELLVDEGLLSEAAVSRALGFQRMSGSPVRLGTILLNWDLLNEEALLGALARLHGCPAVFWPVLSSAPMEIVRLLPSAQAIRLAALPYDAQKGLMRVAFSNPSDIRAVDEVAALTGRRVIPAVTTEVRLLQAHQMFYGRHLPMDYRPIVQRLDRRSTARTTAARDFRAPDLIASERSSVPPAAAGEAVEIPIEAKPAPDPVVSGLRPAGDFDLDQMPALPELAPPASPVPPAPAPASARATADPRPSFERETAEDSLSEWVGDALAAFTGEAPRTVDPPASIEYSSEDFPLPEASPSPSGVEEPALYGREDSEGISDPWAFAAEAEGLELASETDHRAETSPLTDEDRRGVPESIPPFRRAGDPVELFGPGAISMSPLDRDAETVAGMWRPAPDPSSLDSWWDGRVETPAVEARTRDEIAESVLIGSLAAVPRVMLLGAGRAGITGWRGRGPGLTPEIVTAIRVPHAEISVFSAVQESGVPHFGATDRSEWPRAFAQHFGAKPLDCSIFPIRVLDGIAAFLYADRLGEQMKYEDFALIARAAATAAGMVSRFLLDPQRRGPSVRA